MKKVLHRERSRYNDIVVFEKKGERRIQFAGQRGIAQSRMSLKDRNFVVARYARMMCSSLYLMPAPRRVLIIGLGAGILPNVFSNILPDAEITVVEIDPVMVEIARRFFGFRTTDRVTVVEDDGAVFVRTAKREGASYDLVLLDAFSGDGLPTHLVSREFLSEIKAIIGQYGVLAANILSAEDVFRNISSNFRSVYSEYILLQAKKKLVQHIRTAGRNRMILVKRGGLPSADEIQVNSRIHDERLQSLGITAKELLPLFTKGGTRSGKDDSS
jgi:spermidine synthase